MTNTKFYMPPEWAPHEATWIAWPHEQNDWPGKFSPIDWVYCEIVSALARSERVEIVCHNEEVRDRAADCLAKSVIPQDAYRFHLSNNDRSWLRDSAPTGVYDQSGKLVWMHWLFNAWSKYDNFSNDLKIPYLIENVSKVPRYEPLATNGSRLVLEGGGIEVDGTGNLLVSEEWLLSDVQIRNPGVTKKEYEELFAEYLGTDNVIWLGQGIAGDDTHGHIDDLARFVAPETVVTVTEKNTRSINHDPLKDNLRRLKEAKTNSGKKLDVIELPMPREFFFGDDRLPASYANFYISNSVVLVPTFNDPNDRVVLEILAGLFTDREVVGIYSKDLVLGFGTLHCLSQQEPKHSKMI